MSTAISFATTAANPYVPRSRNELYTIFDRHFADFCEQYDEKYPTSYDMYRLERIQQIGERFTTCGDYLQGVARIRCTNSSFCSFSQCSWREHALWSERQQSDMNMILSLRMKV